MKRILALTIGVLLLAALLCGCSAGNTAQPVDVTEGTQSEAETASEAETEVDPAAEAAAPAQGENGLTEWPIGPIALDMDEDGITETITVSHGSEDEVAIEFQSGENVYSEQYELMAELKCYSADIIPQDGAVQLLLIGDTGSCDYISVIFSLVDGELLTDEVDGTVTAVAPGEITVESIVNVLGTYGATSTYQMSEDFMFEPVSVFSILDNDDSRKLTLVRDELPVQLMEDDGSMPFVTLPRGTELMLKETDAISYAVLENLTEGGLVRLELTQDEESWGWYIDGISEEEWFDNLMYAG